MTTASPSLLPTASTGASPGPAATPVADPPFPLLATIPELQAAMESGELTSVELVEFFLARIAAYEDAGPKLNSLIFVNPAARDEAAALDAERGTSGPRGPLHGIPIVVKDNINTGDMPTTAGSIALEDFRPRDDAFQVHRLREAGAIIIAKSNLPEFAASWSTRSELGGQTLNPYDPTRDPGGSSGGTAVAVAANFAAAGLGTDTCGSIRLPAGHSNLYGLRPSSGLSSRAGVIPLSSTLDTVGPMARSVVDLAIVLDATAGEDPADPTTRPTEASFVQAVDPDGLMGRRIGVVDFGATHPPVEEVIESALDEMVANGAELVAVSPPRARYELVLFIREHPSALDEYLASRPEAPVRTFAEIEPGEPMPNLDTEIYRDTVERRGPFRDDIVAFMNDNDLDAIAYPASARVAALVDGEQVPFDCDSAAYGGLPAMVIPAGLTSTDRLPVGLELYARPFDESTLIAIASGYEAHTDRRVLPPTTPPLDR